MMLFCLSAAPGNSFGIEFFTKGRDNLPIHNPIHNFCRLARLPRYWVALAVVVSRLKPSLAALSLQRSLAGAD